MSVPHAGPLRRIRLRRSLLSMRGLGLMHAQIVRMALARSALVGGRGACMCELLLSRFVIAALPPLPQVPKLLARVHGCREHSRGHAVV